MFPSEFGECTLLDIGLFMVANFKRQKIDNEIKITNDYALAKMSAIMNGVNLSNAFSKKGGAKKYPELKEFLPKEEKQKKPLNKNEYSYEEKHEFFKKQIEAYRKMGVKI